jgi:hypothetical protein
MHFHSVLSEEYGQQVMDGCISGESILGNAVRVPVTMDMSQWVQQGRCPLPLRWQRFPLLPRHPMTELL